MHNLFALKYKRSAYFLKALIGLALAGSLSTHALSAPQISVKECEANARAALEKVYCTVLKEGEGETLPDFYDFRRNPKSTQYLFLKKPAKKLGLDLSPPSPETPDRQVDKAEEKPTSTKTPKPSKFAPRLPGNATMPFTSTPADASQLELQGCALKGETIQCAKQQFFLVVNRPISRLDPAVLSPSNNLAFPPRGPRQSLLQYLSMIYPFYIEKMLAIGLGDSTMSFTKFAAIYEDAEKSGEDFAQRFGEMYELLKMERRSNSVKPRYSDNFPGSIRDCMQLTSKLIACDNVTQNWVYQKLTRR